MQSNHHQHTGDVPTYYSPKPHVDRGGSKSHAAKSSGAAGKLRSNSRDFVLKPTHPMRAQLIPTISDRIHIW